MNPLARLGGFLEERLRILDRYILREFLRIFGICVMGVPFIFIVIDLTDQLDSYLADGTGGFSIVVHYIYQFPYQALLAFPVASLLAAVFTVSVMTRHYETTAAKANGISFYRLTAPLLIAGFGISLVALALTELVPITNREAEEALGNQPTRSETTRRRFVFRGQEGRVYRIRELQTRPGQISGLEIDREGTGYEYPTYHLSAANAVWDTAPPVWSPRTPRWEIEGGRIRFFPDLQTARTFRFRKLWQRPFTERPTELLAEPKDPEEMGYFELGRFIEAIQRSGGSARDLIVQRALKIAFPFTCFIIVLFGTPLAHTTRKGGTPVSIGLALATTIVFLMLVRVCEALGAGGTLPPRLAAWTPNLIFLAASLGLMTRVRT